MKSSSSSSSPSYLFSSFASISAPSRRNSSTTSSSSTFSSSHTSSSCYLFSFLFSLIFFISLSAASIGKAPDTAGRNCMIVVGMSRFTTVSTSNFTNLNSVVGMYDCKKNLWMQMGSVGIDTYPSHIAADAFGSFAVVGRHIEVDNIPRPRVVRWDGATASWTDLYGGASGFVSTAHISRSDDITAIIGDMNIIGGSYNSLGNSLPGTGGIPSEKIAFFFGNNQTWYSPDFPPMNSTLLHITRGGNRYYLVGLFSAAGGSFGAVSRRAGSFDLTTKQWSPLGNGFPDVGTTFILNSAAAIENPWDPSDRDTSLVFIGGKFNGAVDSLGVFTRSPMVIAWNPLDNTWNPLGQGLFNGDVFNNSLASPGNLFELAVSDCSFRTDIPGGVRLYVAGSFKEPSTGQSNIIRWYTRGGPSQTGAWEMIDLAWTPNGVVRSVAVYYDVDDLEDRVVIVGDFTAVGSRSFSHIAMYRLGEWVAVGEATITGAPITVAISYSLVPIFPTPSPSSSFLLPTPSSSSFPSSLPSASPSSSPVPTPTTVPCGSEDCNDRDECTVDLCTSSGCSHFPVVCNDNNICTNDFCENGGCEFLLSSSTCIEETRQCAESPDCGDCIDNPGDCVWVECFSIQEGADLSNFTMINLNNATLFGVVSLRGDVMKVQKDLDSKAMELLSFGYGNLAVSIATQNELRLASTSFGRSVSGVCVPSNREDTIRKENQNTGLTCEVAKENSACGVFPVKDQLSEQAATIGASAGASLAAGGGGIGGIFCIVMLVYRRKKQPRVLSADGRGSEILDSPAHIDNSLVNPMFGSDPV